MGTKFRSCLNIIIPVLGLIFLSACSTKIEGLKQDASFTRDAVMAGGLALGGVASNFEKLSEKEKNRNAMNLLIALQEEREDYPLTPMPEVRDAIGKEAFEQLIAQYAADGMLSKEATQTFGSKLKQRYLALIRIEQDDIKQPQWQRQYQKTDSEGRITGSDGMRISIYRTVEASANVYDLHTGMNVWQAKISSYGSSDTTYPLANQELNDVEKVAALSQLIQGKEITVGKKTKKSLQEQYPAPPPPPLYKLLGRTYEKFADSLPD